MKPVFTLANLSDTDELVELMREFYVVEHLAFDEGAARGALRQILSEGRFGVVHLIRVGALTAGYLVVTFGFSLEFHGRDAFIDELYLRENFRGSGIGKASIEFAAAVCRAEGIQRARERLAVSPGIIQGEGVAQLILPGENAPRDFHYSFQANSLTLNASPSGATTVQLGNFTFMINGKDGDKATVRSDVGVRDGEKVIVGTAGLRDKALILVLAAKLIK
jgi:GNAT superfamily N-acetyltransferase